MIEEYKVGEYGLENETEGMYARTDNGIIGKILNSNSDEMINGPEILVNEKIYCIERDSIKDIKENIIDLLEEGDIVNGFSISKFDNEDGNEFLAIPIYNDAQLDCIEEVRPIATIKIKTILTHEQYIQNCYTVERKEEWRLRN